MLCARCHGLMVPTMLVDEESPAGCVSSGWRCLQCGEIIDSVIVAHRTGYWDPIRGRSRLHRTVVEVSSCS